MEIKRLIKDQKGEATFLKFILGTFVATMLFIGAFGFYTAEVADSSLPMSSDMSRISSNITAQSVEIDESIQTVKNKSLSVGNTQTVGVGAIAINSVTGFTGLLVFMAELVSAPLNLISVLFTGSTLPFPSWVTTLISGTLIIVIAFLVVKRATGRGDI